MILWWWSFASNLLDYFCLSGTFLGACVTIHQMAATTNWPQPFWKGRYTRQDLEPFCIPHHFQEDDPVQLVITPGTCFSLKSRHPNLTLSFDSLQQMNKEKRQTEGNFGEIKNWPARLVLIGIVNFLSWGKQNTDPAMREKKVEISEFWIRSCSKIYWQNSHLLQSRHCVTGMMQGKNCNPVI